ncbi:MAG: DoxX family protein [Gammaproteobacteria bacterium]|nr:DoxX family protein [Gammaproteobacteria bacterium]
MNMHISTAYTPAAERLVEIAKHARRLLDSLTPAADLILRLWVANAFFQSGLTKIESFESTIALFTYEYRVPLLSPELAAYAGTFTELFFPALLAVGLTGRLSAFVLFVFNIIAVVSYPGLNEVGLEQHQVWGLMLLLIICRGPGRLSLDHMIARRLGLQGR